MSKEQTKFIQGVQKELKQVGKANNRTFQSILLLYMQERFLFRLSKSKYRDNFVLKGGLLVYCLTQFKGRPTKDVDLLAKQVSPDTIKIETIFREICQIPAEDGVNFNPNSLTSESQDIGNNAVIRITVIGFLGEMKAWVKIDLSFQGVVYPRPLDCDYPVLIDGQGHPQLKVYSIESSIAEKFHAMIDLAELDSRMKDFYDIYTFTNIHSFKGQVLLVAVKETFLQRKTSIEKDHIVFTQEFAQDSKRVAQWQSFLSRIGVKRLEFFSIMERITVFLQPIYDSLYQGIEFQSKWNPSTSQWESR